MCLHEFGPLWTRSTRTVWVYSKPTCTCITPVLQIRRSERSCVTICLGTQETKVLVRSRCWLEDGGGLSGRRVIYTQRQLEFLSCPMSMGTLYHCLVSFVLDSLPPLLVASFFLSVLSTRHMLGVYFISSSVFLLIIVLTWHLFPSVLVFIYSPENKNTQRRMKNMSTKNLIRCLRHLPGHLCSRSWGTGN
jgi:hypothetical protein